jgi:hypothetical protein
MTKTHSLVMRPADLLAFKQPECTAFCVPLQELKGEGRPQMMCPECARCEGDPATPGCLCEAPERMIKVAAFPAPWRAGDSIWIKETFAKRSDIDPKEKLEKARHYLHYKAAYGGGDLMDEWHDYGDWISASKMPRWASRLTLEVLSVKIRKLHDLTDEDAIALGIRRLENGSYTGLPEGRGAETFPVSWATPREAYIDRWDVDHPMKQWLDGWKYNPDVAFVTVRPEWDQPF